MGTSAAKIVRGSRATAGTARADKRLPRTNAAAVQGASLREAARIRALVNRRKFPGGVLRWNAEYGEDATGDPAVWVWFDFKDEEGISQDKIQELAEFVRSVQSDLLDANIGRWAYVGFRAPPG